MQLVTEHRGGFDDVRVRAALFQIDEAHANGYSEVMPAVDVEVKDKDHWISLDANTKRTHAECGTGGLALVRRQQHAWSALLKGASMQLQEPYRKAMVARPALVSAYKNLPSSAREGV